MSNTSVATSPSLPSPVSSGPATRDATGAQRPNPALMYLARLGPGSRRTMAHALTTVANLAGGTPNTLNWAGLRYEHTQAIRARLMEARAPAGVNKILAALRGVLKEAWRLGQMDAESYHRAVDLPSIRSARLPTGRALSKRELQKLFGACKRDVSPLGRRDAAIIALAYGAGLRRSELVGFDCSDYNRDTTELLVRRAKGQKDRRGYVTDGAKAALDAWLDVRGAELGPLFWPADGRGRALVNRRMSDQAVLLLLRRRTAQANVAPFTPHDLRRTFIGDLLDAGADMSVVQQLAGHASIQTTARYDRRGEETKRRAAELLHVPFV